MSLIDLDRDYRVGIIANHDNSEIALSSMVVAVEVSEDSPFWVIQFGRKIENGEGSPIDDRGSLVVEEDMIRDIIYQIDLKKERKRT